MRQTAELGALTEVHARLIGFDLPRRTLAAGHGVTFAVERRNPVAVDHIPAGDFEFDFLSDRDHHLCGGDDIGGREFLDPLLIEGALRLVEVVLVFPPPLLSNDNNLGIPHDLSTGKCDGDRVRSLLLMSLLTQSVVTPISAMMTAGIAVHRYSSLSLP